MKKYKYLIASALLIIIIIFVFIPRPSEKIYVLFDKNEIQCNSSIIEENWQKGSYLICEDLKFINFIKNPDKNSFEMELNKIDKFNITSKKNSLIGLIITKLKEKKIILIYWAEIKTLILI